VRTLLLLAFLSTAFGCVDAEDRDCIDRCAEKEDPEACYASCRYEKEGPRRADESEEIACL